MNTQYRKNLKAVATASKNYTDDKIKKVYYDIGHNDITTDDHINEATYRFTAPANSKLLMLQSIAGNSVKYSPSVASDSTTAYQKTIPSYSPSIDRASASMNILGGMSYKINQRLNPSELKASETLNDVSYTCDSSTGLITFSGTPSATGNSQGIWQNGKGNILTIGHKYLFSLPNLPSNLYIRDSYNDGGIYANSSYIFTSTSTYLGLTINFSTTDAISYNGYWNIFDLTSDFGSGNEPASVSDCATEYAKRGVNIYEYTPQQSAIRDTAPTSVVSKDSNDTTIDTLTIDNNIQALDGYGCGINDTCYNYIDYNAKKFVKKVDKRAYQSGDEEDTSVLTDLTTTYYELATPVETDISEYLDGNEIEIEPNGTLSFESTYSAYVPSNVSYNGVIKHALATAVKQDGFNVWDEEITPNYIYDSTTGQKKYFSGGFSCSANLQKVYPNTTYNVYIKDNQTQVLGFTFYREDGTFIDYSGYVSSFTTPIDCYFIGMNMRGTTYLNDICINISNQDLNGTYKPHKPTITRLLPNSEAKYSWGITDGVRNTRIFCDDEGNAVNEGQLDVGNQDLGGLDYSLYNTVYGAFYSADLINLIAGNTNNLIANFKIESSLWFFNHSSDVQKAIHIYTNKYLYIRDNILWINKTSAIVKSSLSGELLFYEKNATSTETLDDFDYFFDCEEGDTFTLVNTEQLQCYATYSFLIKEAKSNE